MGYLFKRIPLAAYYAMVWASETRRGKYHYSNEAYARFSTRAVHKDPKGG